MLHGGLRRYSCLHSWLRRQARLVAWIWLGHARVLKWLPRRLHAWLRLITSCIWQVHVIHALLLHVGGLVGLRYLCHLALLVCHPLQGHLPLVLQVLGLLLPHHLQLGGELDLSLPLSFFQLEALSLRLFFPQRVQSCPGVLHLVQLVLQALVHHSLLLLFSNILHQLAVHCHHVHEQGLHT